MVPGHREVAGEQDEVARPDDLAPGRSILAAWSRHRAAYRSRRSGLANDRCRSEIAQTFIQRDRKDPASSPTNGFVRLSAPIVVAGPWPG